MKLRPARLEAVVLEPDQITRGRELDDEEGVLALVRVPEPDHLRRGQRALLRGEWSISLVMVLLCPAIS